MVCRELVVFILHGNLWVRSISFPGSTPVCGVFFFQDERVQIITHVRPEKKKMPHTGVDPGKLNERTHNYL